MSKRVIHVHLTVEIPRYWRGDHTAVGESCAGHLGRALHKTYGDDIAPWDVKFHDAEEDHDQRTGRDDG